MKTVVQLEAAAQTRLDQIRSDQIRLDQIRSEHILSLPPSLLPSFLLFISPCVLCSESIFSHSLFLVPSSHILSSQTKPSHDKDSEEGNREAAYAYGDL